MSYWARLIPTFLRNCWRYVPVPVKERDAPLRAVRGVLIGLLFAATPSLAAPGHTGYGTVTNVYPTSSHVFFVEIQVPSNPSGCSNTTWFTYEETGGGGDRVFSLILAAFTSDKQVRVYVNGDCDQWVYSKFQSANAI